MIDLTLSDDEKSLQESVRDVAAKEFPVDEGVRAAVDGRKPFDEARWSRIAGLGWFAIAVPEDKGGIGLGLTHEMLVFTELGRVAATGPLVGTSLAAFIAARAGNEELLEALTSGSKRAGIVVGDLVVDAGTGDLGLRVTPDGTDIVELGEVTPVESIDDAIAVGRVVSSTSVLHVSDADIVRRLRVLVAAYLIGLAEATTDMSAEYAKIREQFGKPIGTFQAVKHRCAEMVSRAYVARAQLNMAAVLADRDVTGNGDLEVASALLLALDAGQRNSEDNIQNHGGIGVTAEHPAGVFVKRAQVYRHLAGRKSELNQIALNDPESGAA